MKEKYLIQKKWGETPLEALERLRVDEKIGADVPMTYAGRLDPAAEGLLIILTGEECKKKDEYSALSKTYVAEIILGVSTDSYDLLGIPKVELRIKNLESSMEEIKKYLDINIGKQMQEYPHYSSKNIDTGVLPLPHEVELFEYKNLEIGERTQDEVSERVKNLTELVTGDFRQAKISEAWKTISIPEKLQTIKVELKVSSGFYIRQLAEDLGKALCCGACLYSLVRTEIE
ncbi:MAG: hypothetical protein KBC17_01225 [Candidatus Pacebacteria bacterium]|nr:hypothetical protein [Candidatus Paceibacterota bacterium]